MGGAARGGAEPSAAAEPAATAATVVRGLPEGMCRAAALARRRRPLQVTLPFLALPLPLLSKMPLRVVLQQPDRTMDRHVDRQLRLQRARIGRSFRLSLLFHCIFIDLSMPFHCPFITTFSLTFHRPVHCLPTPVVWAQATKSASAVTTSRIVGAPPQVRAKNLREDQLEPSHGMRLQLFTAFPLPFHCLPLTFHYLSLTFH